MLSKTIFKGVIASVLMFIGAGLWAASISGTLSDENSNPISGGTMTLYDGDYNIVDTTVSADDGTYVFSNAPDAADLTVEPYYQIYSFSPSTQTVDTSAGDVSGIDFTGSLEPPIISGKVLDTEGNPISNLKIMITDTEYNSVDTVYTNDNGVYYYKARASTYNIVPETLSGYVISPSHIQKSLSSDSIVDNADFTAFKGSPLEIPGCQLWLDGADPTGDGSYIDGELTVWADKSGNENNATQASEDDSAFVLNNALNGYSVVNLPVGKAYFSFSRVHSRTLFWVIKESPSAVNSYYSRSFMGVSDGKSFMRGTGPNDDGLIVQDGKIWDDEYAAPEVINGKTYLDGQAVDGINTVFPNNEFHILSLVTAAPDGSTGLVDCDQLSQTKNYIDSSWKGQIAEVIVYDQALSDTDRETIEHYLKRKWFAPVGVDDSYLVMMDNQLTVLAEDGVLANDKIDINVELTAMILSEPSNGNLNFNSDGSFTYTPTPAFYGTDKFTYKAYDGDAYSNSVTVNIVVRNPDSNIPPVAHEDVYKIYGADTYTVTPENGVLVNDDDKESDPLTAKLVDNVQYGTLELNTDGSFSYTPKFSWYGTDTFTYLANDGFDDGNVVTVTLDVRDKLNEPTEISGCTLWLDGADPAGDGSAVAGKLEGWLNKADENNIGYQVYEDKQAELISNVLNGHSVIRFAAGVESYPIVSASSYMHQVKISANTVFWVIKENETLMENTVPFFLGDSEGTPFHRGIGDADSGYAFEGQYWDDEFAAPEVINGKTYLDGIEVNGTEDIFPAGDFYIVSAVLTGPVSFDSISQDRNGLYGARGWQGDIAEIITYDKALSDSERQWVRDYLQRKWSFSGISVDDDFFIIEKNKECSVPAPGILQNDNGENLTAVLVDDVKNGTLTLNPDGSFLYTPDTDFTGDDTFTYKGTDNEHICNVATVTIRVKDASENAAPVASDDSYVTYGSSPLDINSINGILANDSDADLDPLYLNLVDDVKNGTLTLNSDGSFSYLPNLGWSGTDTFTYVISDSIADSNLATVNIEVHPVLEDPRIFPGCTLWLDGADPKGDGSEVSERVEWWENKADNAKSAFQPYPFKQAKVIPNALNGHSVMDFSYDGEHGYVVWDAANDESVKITGQTFFWVVKEIDNGKKTPHFFLGDSEGTPFHRGVEDQWSNYTADGRYWDEGFAAPEVINGQTYLDGMPVNGIKDVFPVGEYHIVSLVTTGPVQFDSISQDRIEFASRSWVGEIAEIITYDTLLSESERHYVEEYLKTKWLPALQPGDDVYVIEKNKGKSVSAPGILKNDKGENVTVTLESDVSNGTLTLNEDGSFVYTPNTAFVGTDSFTYTINDGKTLSQTATVSLEVRDTETNQPPASADDLYSILKNETLTVKHSGVLSNDADAENENITANLIDNVSHGSLTFNLDGSFTYTPEIDWTGTDSFTYVANDGLFDGNTATVTINVIPEFTKPTDISGCALWLDGADPKGDGTEITGALETWINKASTKNFAYQVNSELQPEVVPDALNGLSVLHFADSLQTYSIVNSNDLDEQVKISTNTVFWVIKENKDLPKNAVPFLLADSDATPFHRSGSYFWSYNDEDDDYFACDGGYWDGAYAAAAVLNGKTYLDGRLLEGYWNTFPAGEYHVVSVVLTGPVEIDSISQDKDGVYGPRSWQGDIAEIIIYNQALSENARKTVEKHLELKWFGEVYHEISGIVTDSNLKPIKNMWVKIDGKDTRTDEDGKYTMGGFKNGTYKVTLDLSYSKYTFNPASVSVTVDNADVTFDFKAEPLPTYTISGTVLDAEGAGIKEVVVSVYDERQAIDDEHQAITDEDGKYTVSDLVSASYTVTPVLSGYNFDPVSTDVSIYDADKHNIDFTATVKSGEFSISGTVFDENNAPLQGVIVKADAAHYATTDADGNYTITNLPNGTYDVIPVLDGYSFSPDKQLVTIADENITEQNFAVIVNSAPVAVDDEFLSVIEDTTLTVSAPGLIANDSDNDEDALTVVLPIASQPAHGALEVNEDGSFTYTPNTGFVGDDSFSYKVTDGTDDSNVATVKISVIQPSVAHNVSGQIIDVTGKPIEGVTVSIDKTHSAVTDENGMYILSELLDGAYTVTPVKDGYTFNPAIQNVTIEGADITLTEFTGSLSESQKYTLTVNNGTGTGEYASSTEVTISATVPAGKVFDAWTGDVQYIADVKSPDTIATMPAADITITATFKDIVVATYSISGKITDKDGKGLADVVVSIDATRSGITDADGNYIISDILSGSYELTPVLEGYAFVPAKLTVVVNEADVTGQDFEAIENSAPVAVDDAFFSVTEDTALNVPVSGVLSNDSDPDGDVIVAMIAANPTKGTVILNQDGSFTYTPNAGENGNDTFTYVVKDDKGAISNEATVTITINPAGVNNTPVALNDKFLTLVDTELVVPVNGILVNDFDVDGDTLSVKLPINSQPENGSVSVNKDGSFTYIPNPEFEGEDSFTYTVTDGTVDSNVATVKISIVPPDGHTPVANNEEYKMEVDTKLSISAPGVLENDIDPDGGELNAALVDDVKKGTLKFNADGSFTYTPSAGFEGKDAFTYVALDENNEKSNIATVIITVSYQKVTLGTPVTVSPQQAHLLAGETFDKGKAKIYGVLDGKNLNLKKDKSSAPELLKAFWAKKYPLYNKKTVKNGYAAAIDNQNQAKNIPLTVKGKSNGAKFENQVQTVKLVPPQITSVSISDTTITIKGKYFGIKAPKVALEPIAGGKLVKCKVDKKSYSFDITEKADSTVTATYKAKKAPAGSYRLILDNKIGIGVEINDEGKEVLPIIQIGGN